MRVILAEPITVRLRKAIYAAHRENRTIERIELTKEEGRELSKEIANTCMNPGAIFTSGSGHFMGIPMEWPVK